MSIFPLNELLTTLKDLTSRALRIKGEVSLTNNSIPDNEPVPIKLTGSSLQEETKTVFISTSLAAQTNQVVLDIANKEIEIQFLDFATTETSGVVNLQIKAYLLDDSLETSYMYNLNLTGSEANYFAPNDINTNKSNLFDYMGINKISLKRSIKFANGCRILINNGSNDTAYTVGISVTYKQTKKGG